MRSFLVFLSFVFLSPLVGFAATPEELRQSIEAKAQELLRVNEQIQNTQKKLGETGAQKNSLQKEIRQIDYSINQLNLGVKSSQIKIEKLGLELESIQYEIADIRNEIGVKKTAVAKLFRELYEKERQGLLVAILRHGSLAESFLEGQTIANLNSGLSIEVVGLKNLNIQLSSKFQITAGKKQDIEIENQGLKARRSIVEDQKLDKQGILSQTKNQEKTYASLIDTLEKKQAEISAEIEKVEEELRAKIDPSLLPIPRPGVLEMPVKGILSQNYGATAFARYGYRGQFHNGVDIAAPIGMDIYSAEDGNVVAVGDQDTYCYRGAYGKYVVVAHDNNLTTLYAHLSKQAVQKGDIIERGQVIGYVGRTGYATGPHLHLTVYAGPTFYMGASRVCGPMPLGGDLNPTLYLKL